MRSEEMSKMPKVDRAESRKAEKKKIRGQPPAHRGLPSGLYALRAGSGPGGRTEGPG